MTLAAFFKSWFWFAIMAAPFFGAIISFALSIYISRRHLDAMIEALKGSRHIAIGAAALLPNGLFGRFLMILKICGALTWPGPFIRAGEMNEDEIRAFPRHLRNWIKAKIWLNVVGFSWGCTVALIIKFL